MSMTWTLPKTDWTGRDFLNADDFNRIENNVAFLTEELNQHGYDIETNTRTWERQDIPTTADIKRICDNITAIIGLYFKAKEHPVSDPAYGLPCKMLNWEHINDLEDCLHRLKTMLAGGAHCNTYRGMKICTHGELKALTNKQVRRAVLPNDTKPRMLPSGQIALISNKGQYNTATVYKKYDYVLSTQGNGFIAKADKTVDIAPPETAVESGNWIPFVW